MPAAHCAHGFWPQNHFKRSGFHTTLLGEALEAYTKQAKHWETCIFLCKYDASSGNMCPFFMPQLDTHLQPSAIHWQGYGLSLHVNVASWEPDNIVKDLLLSLWWARESGLWGSRPIANMKAIWIPMIRSGYICILWKCMALLKHSRVTKTLATSLGSWSLWYRHKMLHNDPCIAHKSTQ